MRIRKPGKIADRLWFLGTEELCVYLLEGENSSMLINGGVSCIVPALLAQFSEFSIDESRIDKILILHSHFDHVGIIPFFKRRNPETVIYGSPRTLQIIQKPKALESINAAGKYVIKINGMEELCSRYDLDWSPGITGEPVTEGTRIDLGDMEVCIIETPGHSPCSVAAYIPRLKALFPSDAGGIPSGETIVTYGTSDFDKFEESLGKLKDLDVNYLCSDHCGFVAGDEAVGFIAQALEAAGARREVMLDAYKRTGDPYKAARELAIRFSHENVGHIVSDETFVEAHRQMVMHVAGLKIKASGRG
jgi:2-aminobenzoylacetyl-CoA thioesterase